MITELYRKERVSHSCIYAAQPSVIMTNEVVGGLMVAEARAVLSPQNYGSPIRKMLKYDSTNPSRGGLVGGEAPCKCSKPSMSQWIKEVERKKNDMQKRFTEPLFTLCFLRIT